MRVARRFTLGLEDAYAGLKFVPRRSEIRNPDGTLVFEADGVMVPDGWSQVATDILAQKYLRRAGVPAHTKRVPESVSRSGRDPIDLPTWLQRSVPDEEALSVLPPEARFGRETDARQVIDRLFG